MCTHEYHILCSYLFYYISLVILTFFVCFRIHHFVFGIGIFALVLNQQTSRQLTVITVCLEFRNFSSCFLDLYSVDDFISDLPETWHLECPSQSSRGLIQRWTVLMAVVTCRRTIIIIIVIVKVNLLIPAVEIMGTAIKHPVPDRVKPSFVIFDIRALWRSGPGCQKLQMSSLT